MKHFYFFILILFTCCNIFAQTNNELIKLADDIHKKILTIDTHTDTPMLFSSDTSIDLGKLNSNTKVDFPKMQNGGLDAVFMAVYLPQGKRDEVNNYLAKNKALSILQLIKKQVEKYPEIAKVATTPDEVYRLKYQGKRAVLIGLENGYPIGDKLTNLRLFQELGVVYITLSHTKNNDICDSSNDIPEHNGLSSFGKDVICEMNRLGMIIDVSHTSDKTIRDVISYSKAPVIASHSCAKKLTNNRRNLSDDMIQLIAKNGGVVQVCMVSHFVKLPALGKATVSDVVDHIDHIVKLAGINHVGVGSDFDGGAGVIGCKNVSEMKNITIELLRRGYKSEEIEKIWGGNFLRVMTDVQKLTIFT